MTWGELGKRAFGAYVKIGFIAILGMTSLCMGWWVATVWRMVNG